MKCNNILCPMYYNMPEYNNCMKNEDQDYYSYIKCNKFKIHFLELNDILLLRTFIDRIMWSSGEIYVPKRYVKKMRIFKNQYVFIKEPFIELDNDNNISYLATEVSPFVYDFFSLAKEMNNYDIRLRFIIIKNTPTYLVFKFLENDNLSKRHLKDWSNDWLKHKPEEVQKLLYKDKK